jgi:hypothetical protein
MFTSQESKMKKIIFLIFLILATVSCARKDPSIKYNRKFLKRHGKDVAKAKKRHKRITKRNKEISLRESELKQAEITKRKEEAVKYDEYAEYRGSVFGDYYSDMEDYQDEPIETELDYLNRNVSVYEVRTINFDDIVIPRRDIFADSYLGEKDFEFVNNKNMQESFDYLYVIKKERDKNFRILELKKERLAEIEQKEEQEEQKDGALEKVKKTVKSFKDRVLDLIGKGEKKSEVKK